MSPATEVTEPNQLQRSPTVADDIAISTQQPPVQPSNVVFPVTVFSGKGRSFNPSWYQSYRWLEYSVKCDACFCYPCRMFGSSVGGGYTSRPVQVFTLKGFRDWKHATGKSGSLAVHDACRSHKQAVVAWDSYTHTMMTGVTVADQLGNARAELVQKNRQYLKTIAEVLLLCARQDISLRGHRESADSTNRGNFLSILALVASHDSSVHQQLTNNPRNAVYTSPDVQNTLLNVMGERVRKRISAAVIKAKFFSILADETKDLSKKEQISVVVRYVESDTCKIYERFLTFVHAETLDAAAFSSYLLKTLSDFGFDTKWLVSQGYDGASVMSGKKTGVQQRIKEIAPQAVYIHCHAHCLNLVLVDCSKQVDEFFQLLEALYVFISTSKAHEVYISQQSQLHPDNQIHQMQRLSDTRWACRYAAVDTVCSTYKSVLATLTTIIKDRDKAKAIEATGLYLQINTPRFRFLLSMFRKLLSTTKRLSDLLQCKDIDIGKATDLVVGTTQMLSEYREKDEYYLEVLQHSAANVEIADQPTNVPATARPRRTLTTPSRYNDSVVMDTTGSRPDPDSQQNWKTSIYFPVLDCMVSEMNRRFSGKNLQILQAVPIL